MDNNTDNEILEILQTINKESISSEDKDAMKKILEKYKIQQNEQNVEPEFILEPEFELPNDDWEPRIELDEIQEQINTEQEPSIIPEVKKFIPQVDEDGQYLLPLEDEPQIVLDVVNKSEEIETKTINDSSRIEPVFSLDEMDVEAQAITMHNDNIKPQKFKQFESMAQNSLGKVKNFFNFKNEDGKLDWHNVYSKTVLVVSGTTNALLDNKVVNGLTSFIGKKFKSSKLGVHTTKIADTLTINLMSREDRYNKDFKNTMALMGYSVTELIKPTNEPMLSLEDVSKNIKDKLSESLSVKYNDNTITIKSLENLTPEQKVESINKFIWPKITSMLEESIKLSYAARETRDKNPLYKKIKQVAELNGISEELFVHYLLKDPDFLKNNQFKEFSGLLLKKPEIESLYFKLEEISAKNFVVMQNIVKVGLSIQKTVDELPIEKEEKQAMLLKFNNTVIANKNNKQIVFSTLQESVLDSLKDENYKKSLVEVNSSILKIREMNQNKEQVNKPKM